MTVLVKEEIMVTEEINKEVGFKGRAKKFASQFKALVKHDMELLSEANDFVDYASLEIAIQTIIEKIEEVMVYRKNFSERVTAEKEMERMPKKELTEIKTRQEYKKRLEEEMRKEKRLKAEAKVLKNAFSLSAKPDTKLLKGLESYVRDSKKILVKAIKQRDALYKKYQPKIDKCDNLEDIYEIVVEIKDELKLAKTAAKIVSEKTKDFLSLGKKDNKTSNENTFADESKLELLQPTVMGLIGKAINKIGESKFVSESTKQVGHISIKIEDYLIKFEKENINNFYIFVAGTPLVCGEELLCSNKEVDDLLTTISRFWKEI